MNPSLPFVRADALPLLSVSAVILGLFVLLPLPAHAAEQRLVGDVVVRARESSTTFRPGSVTSRYTDW